MCIGSFSERVRDFCFFCVMFGVCGVCDVCVVCGVCVACAVLVCVCVCVRVWCVWCVRVTFGLLVCGFWCIWCLVSVSGHTSHRHIHITQSMKLMRPTFELYSCGVYWEISGARS